MQMNLKCLSVISGVCRVSPGLCIKIRTASKPKGDTLHAFFGRDLINNCLLAENSSKTFVVCKKLLYLSFRRICCILRLNVPVLVDH